MINFITISILDFGVTSHNVIDQSMIINFEMKKISGGEAKQNPRYSTYLQGSENGRVVTIGHVGVSMFIILISEHPGI
jgi:hypothetical protein